MSADDSEPTPQSLAEASAERRALRAQLQSAREVVAVRLKGLFDRWKTITKFWEESQPHAADQDDKFQGLHRACLDLVRAKTELERRTIDATRQIYGSGSIVKKFIANSTRSKALNTEQRFCHMLREELNQGIKERTEILDQFEVAINNLEAFVEGAQPK